MITATVHAADVRLSFPGRARGSAPVEVLRGISLDVRQGEMLSVVGPSGSGKSSLLHVLAGLEPPTAGRVAICGQEVTGQSAAQVAAIRRADVGFVFQAYNLIPSLSVSENVALPARLAKHPVSPADVEGVLTVVGLGGRGGDRPAELSGGEQQRVAMARVLLARPRVIFADEPTGALDGPLAAAVLAHLRSLTSRGTSIVLVTHDLEAAALADRTLVMRDGRMQAHLIAPTARQLFDATRAAVAERAA